MNKPVREIPTSLPALHQQVREAILHAVEGYTDEKYVKWANGWLDGSDQSARAAGNASALAERSIYAASSAAYVAAAKAARRAALAAYSLGRSLEYAASAAARAARVTGDSGTPAKINHTMIVAAAAKLREAFGGIVPEEEQLAWHASPTEVLCGVAAWLERLGGPLTEVSVSVAGKELT